MTGTADELFAPPGSAWQPVSSSLSRMRRTVLCVTLAVVAILWVGLDIVLGLPTWSRFAAVTALAVGAGHGWWVIGHNARRWGYAERDEELYITRGALYRRLTVVPYGRMQYVDVQAGPVERAYGLARVQLHTASPGTSAHIPGLSADEAARLRDRLTALGEAQAAGL